MTSPAGFNAIIVIGHAPLATALTRAAAHVLPAPAADLVAIDIDAARPLEQNCARVRAAVQAGAAADGVLVLTDVLGATPCNIATALVRRTPGARLLAGVNLPMLLRALTYRDQPLDVLVQRALDGGVAGVVAVPMAAAECDLPAGDCGAA